MHERRTSSASTVERTGRGPVGDSSRYDLALAVILIAFLAAVFAGSVGPVSYAAAMRAAALVGALVVADALFVNPPGRNDRR